MESCRHILNNLIEAHGLEIMKEEFNNAINIATKKQEQKTILEIDRTYTILRIIRKSNADSDLGSIVRISWIGVNNITLYRDRSQPFNTTITTVTRNILEHKPIKDSDITEICIRSVSSEQERALNKHWYLYENKMTIRGRGTVDTDLDGRKFEYILYNLEL